MTAKEMFEEVGFKYEIDNEVIRIYYREPEEKEILGFDNDKKRLYIQSSGMDTIILPIKMFNIIKKQIEELNW
jgi:hypothetical protein